MANVPVVLVVDDEIRSQETLKRMLADEFHVLTASNAEEAEDLLEGELVQAILCDQRMPGISGVEFLRHVRRRWPDPVRMIISGYTDSEDIIAGLNDAGIYQYITKPWDPDGLMRTVQGAVQLYDLQRANQSASIEMKLAPEALRSVVNRKKETLKSQFGFDRMVHSANSPLCDSLDLAGRVAGYDISVLITGESGTGKELLARAIHYSSGRAEKPFVVENCGALPDELLESELFGCKKGAFTGAYEDRIGLFEQANGGTIFLDEIGETSPAFQVKLLRVLQEGEIRPLGGRIPREVNVRVIAATNRNLEEEVAAGRFRRDLYYRLAAFPVHLPALKARPMDIQLLAERLLGDAMRLFQKPVQGFTDETIAILRRYDWPGNVRELQNEVHRMVALADGDTLGPDLISDKVKGVPRPLAVAPAGGYRTLKDQVDELEASVIAECLERHDWNISRAAEELGLSRVGLRGKLQRFGLERGD